MYSIGLVSCILSVILLGGKIEVCTCLALEKRCSVFGVVLWPLTQPSAQRAKDKGLNSWTFFAKKLLGGKLIT